MAEEAPNCKKCRAKVVKCPRCNGKGTIYSGTLMSGYSEKPCPNCNGLGYRCPTHGTNWS